jgi:hypothetical protein
MRERVTAVRLLCLLACVAMAMSAWAQEGHPLTGSWRGDWGPSTTQRNHLVFLLKQDGSNLVGTINPGQDGIPLKVVTLDVSKWTVHFEADAKDGTHIVADGKLENIGSPYRTITGNWTQGTLKGTFKLTRN